MKEITYNDMPCYVIQKKVPFDDFYYSLYMQFAKNNFQTLPKWIGKKSFKAGFPNVMLFYIGKDNKFIYTIKVYNPSGKLLIELNYKNVVINPIIKDSVFTLPSNVTVRPVSSREDYIDVSTEIVKQTAPDTIKEIRKTHKKELRKNYIKEKLEVISNSFWNNIDLFTYFFVVLAIISLVIAIIIKKKAK